MRGLSTVQRGMLADTARAFRLGAMIVVWLCARRLGKSHGLCWYADQHAQSIPGSDVIYCAATEASVREFSGPIMDRVLAERAPEARPVWRASESTWFYANGSRITLIGIDEVRKLDRARGRDSALVIIDEAAFVPVLGYAINSVFLPMLLRLRGRLLIASSAPTTPAHAFVDYVNRARAHGALIFRTIRDADPSLLSPEAIEAYVREVGGWNSTSVRRELLCEIVADDTSAVVPEMSERDAESEIVGAVAVPPPHALRYVAIDGGYIDMRVGVLGYAWHEERILVIEDEIVTRRALSRQFARNVLDTMTHRWGEGAKVERIVADDPPQTVADMQAEGLAVVAHGKDEVEVSVARLRELVKERRLLVHPRCHTVISHLKGAQWNPARTDMVRPKGPDGQPLHHFDALSAVRYLADVADLAKSPAPRILSIHERLGLVPVRDGEPLALGFGARRRVSA